MCAEQWKELQNVQRANSRISIDTDAEDMPHPGVCARLLFEIRCPIFIYSHISRLILKKLSRFLSHAPHWLISGVFDSLYTEYVEFDAGTLFLLSLIREQNLSEPLNVESVRVFTNRKSATTSLAIAVCLSSTVQCCLAFVSIID